MSVLGIAAFGLTLELLAEPVVAPDVWLLDLGVGVLLASVGAMLVGVESRPQAGLSLMAAGFTWFAGNVSALGVAGVSDAFGTLTYLHRGLVVAAVMLLRPARREVVVAIAVASTTLVPAIRAPSSGVLVWSGLVVTMVGIVLSRGWPRRSRRWGLAAVLLVAGAVAAVAGAGLVAAPAGVWSQAATWGYDVCVVLAAFAVWNAAVGLRTRPVPVTDAVLHVALGPSAPARGLLADALQDPRLELAFVTPAGGWIDETGAGRPPVSTGPGRARVTVSIAGTVVAEISCREDVARAAPVVRAIDDATRLVATNARLRASLRREADGLRESRLRLLTVLDEERRALEVRLTATIAEPLADLDRSLAALPRGYDLLLDGACERCRVRQQALVDDLHHLVAGLGPASLTTGGLGDAVAALTAPLQMPVTLRLDTSTLPPLVSTTVYLVCAEAVSNMVKHSEARRLDVSITSDERLVRVVVTDDGRGGADLERGTGLAGLLDRVTALGGSFQVISPEGGPTTVRADLPMDVAGG